LQQKKKSTDFGCYYLVDGGVVDDLIGKPDALLGEELLARLVDDDLHGALGAPAGFHDSMELSIEGDQPDITLAGVGCKNQWFECHLNTKGNIPENRW